jgi:hypothetical protein
MSDARVLDPSGLTLSVIDIIAESQDIYNAAARSQELSEVFQAISEYTPLVLEILRSCKRAQEQVFHEYTKTTDASRRSKVEDSNKALKPLMLDCLEAAKRLHENTERIFPDAATTDMTAGRYRWLARAFPERESEAKDLMIDLLKTLQSMLESKLLFQDHEQQNENNKEALATAISQLSELRSSSRGDRTQHGHISIGSGSQLHAGNNYSSGEAYNYNGDFSFGTSRFDD